MQLTRRILLGGAMALAARPAAAACAVSTAIPIDLSAGPCIVTAMLDGMAARMVLDTGAERTLLNRAAVARRRLRLDPWVGTTMRGAGGRLDEHQNAMVGSLRLGGEALFQRVPGETLSLPVTSLDLGGLDGLIGGDVLRHHTLDLDAPAGTLALLAAGGCGGLAPGAIGIPLQLLRRSLPLAEITLDGHKMTALVDTGASISLINARGLFKVGLAESRLQADPTVSALGIGGRFTGRQHRFGELRIGSMRFAAPSLLTLAVPEPAFDVVLGLDILARQRMRLSYGGGTLEVGH